MWRTDLGRVACRRDAGVGTDVGRVACQRGAGVRTTWVGLSSGATPLRDGRTPGSRRRVGGTVRGGVGLAKRAAAASGANGSGLLKLCVDRRGGRRGRVQHRERGRLVGRVATVRGRAFGRRSSRVVSIEYHWWVGRWHRPHQRRVECRANLSGNSEHTPVKTSGGASSESCSMPGNGGQATGGTLSEPARSHPSVCT